MINLWDGQPATLQNTTIHNWQIIQNINNTLANTKNRFAQTNAIQFDLTTYDLLNRDFRNLFLKNAKLAIKFLKTACNSLDTLFFKHDKNFKYQQPIIPQTLVFDENSINNFWETVSNDCLFLINTINANKI